MDNYGNSQNVTSSQEQTQKLQDANLRIYEDGAKKYNALELQKQKNQLELNKQYGILEVKEIHAAYAEENRLAKCEVVEIEENGEIHIVSKNMQIETKPRKATNFKPIQTVTFINADNPEEKIFFIKAELDNTRKTIVHIFLNPAKYDRPRYIKKKLASSGIDIRGRNEAKKQEYAQMIVTRLMRDCEKSVWIPKRRGWYQHKDSLQFFEGTWTWKELIKNAK